MFFLYLIFTYCSLSHSRFLTPPSQINRLLDDELHDLSLPLRYSVAKRLGSFRHSGNRGALKDIIDIQKRVEPGRVRVKIVEHFEPRDINREFGAKAFVTVLLFLVGGLLFTLMVKVYSGTYRLNGIK